MSKSVSERRRQRRHYLKQVKKQMSNQEFQDLKKSFANEGKNMRIEELRESLEEEKDILANKEGELRASFKKQGLKKKEIDQKIEDWYNNCKIWSLHSDVQDDLI